MRIILTIIAIVASAALFSQQTYHVTQNGSGNKNGKSWENAINDLGKALDAAQSGDAIWVAEGIYYGGFFMKEGVSVYGGFAGTETQLTDRKMPGTNENLCILDGDDNYRVLTQGTDFATSTVWDGFVIQNGSSQTGGGVYLRNNGIVRRCIIKNNSTLMPAVGDYIAQEGGVIFQVDKQTKKAWIIAEDDCGRNYQIYNNSNATSIVTIDEAILDLNGKINTALLTNSRPANAIQAYRGGGKSGWYIPSAGEWAIFLELQNDGTFQKTKTFELVENSLAANGKTALSGKKYWSSTASEQNDMKAAWYANFQNEDIQKINSWQYNRLRGMRYYTVVSDGGKGGGIFAIEGSRIEGCLITENSASLGSGVCARGVVVLLNNTVVGNVLETSAVASSAIDGNSVVKVYNTVVVDNKTASGDAEKHSGAPYYAYSAVETSYIAAGESNILLNNISEIGFTDASSKDYTLTKTSAIAEAGNIAYLPLELDTDLANKARTTNQKVSIGAYQTKETSNVVNSSLTDISIYPNPVKSSESFYITVEPGITEGLIEIYDIVGKKIVTKKINLQERIQAPEVVGTYILNLTLSDNTVYRYKLVVK